MSRVPAFHASQSGWCQWCVRPLRPVPAEKRSACTPLAGWDFLPRVVSHNESSKPPAIARPKRSCIARSHSPESGACVGTGYSGHGAKASAADCISGPHSPSSSESASPPTSTSTSTSRSASPKPPHASRHQPARAAP